VEKQLNNTNFYERETHNKTQENNKIVENTIISEINKRNLPEDAKFLVIDNPRTSTFYLLPKIHKVGNPGRPIISTCLQKEFLPTLMIFSNHLLRDFLLTSRIQRPLSARYRTLLSSKDALFFCSPCM
jgi:hypothetical protein